MEETTNGYRHAIMTVRVEEKDPRRLKMREKEEKKQGVGKERRKGRRKGRTKTKFPELGMRVSGAPRK